MKSNFKVVLINPSNNEQYVESYSPTEHLGLAYLTAVLRLEGYKVKLIDAYALNLSKEEVSNEVIEFNPDFVGITCEYNTVGVAIDMINVFSERLKYTHLSMGGQHATFSSEELLIEVEGLNSILRGEGEKTIVEVMNSLHDKKDLSGIRGVYYRDAKGNIIRNSDREAVEDLDALPFPARDTLIRCQKEGITPAISILSSRGCQFNCSFCNASKYFSLGGGNRWRGRTPKNIVDEIEDLIIQFEDSDMYDVIYFSDENFVGPGKDGLRRVSEIADEIVRRNISISFEIFCRADSFNGNEELVKKLSRAGLISALVGLESGYQKSLNGLSKGTTVNSNINTIELFRKYNIITSSSGFLMFNPYSTFKEVEENAKFLLKIGMATLYNMSLKVLGYPGIRYINQLEEDNLLTKQFGHKNVSGYKFKESKMSQLVKGLEFDEALGRKEDAMHRYLDLSLTDIDRKLVAISLVQNETITIMKKRVNDARFDAQLITYNFFIKLLSLSQREWDVSVYETYKETYIQEINEGLETLNQVYDDYINGLSSFIDEEDVS